VVPYLILAGCVLFVALICWLIQRSHNRQRKERELLRAPPPDFSDDFWNGPADNAGYPNLFESFPMQMGGPATFRNDGDDDDVIDLELASEAASPPATEYTAVVEPNPLFGTRATVRQSYMRAVKHLERCSQAAYERRDYVEAEAFARAALRELNLHMRRDHWYAPYILNWLGYLRYEQGFTVEGKEFWEQAEQVALEWFEQCQDILPDIQRNLKVFHENF
jgi:hypothetical protein